QSPGVARAAERSHRTAPLAGDAPVGRRAEEAPLRRIETRSRGQGTAPARRDGCAAPARRRGPVAPARRDGCAAPAVRRRGPAAPAPARWGEPAAPAPARRGGPAAPAPAR